MKEPDYFHNNVYGTLVLLQAMESGREYAFLRPPYTRITKMPITEVIDQSASAYGETELMMEK